MAERVGQAGIVLRTEKRVVFRIAMGLLNGHPTGWKKEDLLKGIVGGEVTEKTGKHVLELIGPTGASIIANFRYDDGTNFIILDRNWSFRELLDYARRPPCNFRE